MLFHENGCFRYHSKKSEIRLNPTPFVKINDVDLNV